MSYEEAISHWAIYVYNMKWWECPQIQHTFDLIDVSATALMADINLSLDCGFIWNCILFILNTVPPNSKIFTNYEHEQI